MVEVWKSVETYLPPMRIFNICGTNYKLSYESITWCGYAVLQLMLISMMGWSSN